MAIDYGLVGPNLRASGVDFDIRRAHPYSVYKDFTFKVPVGKGYAGERTGGKVGDSYDRFYCRVLECRQSVAITRQACDQLPAGEFMSPKLYPPTSGRLMTCRLVLEPSHPSRPSSEQEPLRRR